MNRKLFTLAAALMMGSAFTVNAQTEQVKDGTPLNGGAWYYIADGASPSNYIAGVKDPDGNTVWKTVSSITTANKNQCLWKVSTVNVNGKTYVKFYNKETEGYLSFDEDLSTSSNKTFAVNSFVWDNLKDANKDGTWEYVKDGNKEFSFVAKNAGGGEKTYTSYLNTGVWKADEGGTNKTGIYLYQENTKVLDVDDLNGLLGNGFSFSFPKADPAPAENVFDQKLYAFNINNTAVSGRWDNEYASGTYFALSEKPADVTSPDDVQNWFLTTEFIALDPATHLDILDPAKGTGFKFVTVMGKDIKKLPSVAGAVNTSKTEIASNNAAFTVKEPDPVNGAGVYNVSLDSVVVKTDLTKDAHAVKKNLNVVATKVAGTTYVTTSDNAASPVKLSATNLAAAKDILSETSASVFNILFTSGKANLANGSEYGKYLGLGYDKTSSATKMVAQGSALVDLDAPQNQWVITAVSGDQFTFTNCEDGTYFTTTLRKTGNANEYELSSNATFHYAYYDDDFKYTVNPAINIASTEKLSAKTVELKPVSIDKTGGYADYSDEELAQLVKMQFTAGKGLLSKDVYVSDNISYGLGGGITSVTLDVNKDIAKAAQWELIKRTGATDSIYSTMSYAYWNAKDKAVKADGKVENRAIVTYSVKLYTDDAKDWYYNGSATLIDKKAALAPRFVIRENVDGSIALIAVGNARDYSFTKNCLGLNQTSSSLDYTESIYALTDAKSYLYFGTEEATPSLETVARHASFQSVNGGFLGVGAEGDAIIAATKDEAQELTFWLDTADVEKYTPSFYISQGIKAETKADAAEVRNFLFNATDSTSYYDAGTASTITDWSYLTSTGDPKAIFKAGTLVNKDSLNTIVAGKEVGLNNKNGLKNFKFNIVLADADVADEYVIKSVADNTYLSNINGKVALVDVPSAALVVNLGAGDATANEAIAAESGVQVIGGQGVVTVQGAAGKVITVANILGQTIANQVAASDNVTIAAPAGVVVVAVDGEATKVVVK